MARSRIVRRTGPKRRTAWIGPADQTFSTISSGAKAIIASFDASASGLIASTVIRTRGEVYHSPSVDTADLTYKGAWGLGIVTDRVFTAGAASIPGPFTDAGWDGWFAWGSFTFKLGHASDVGVQEIGATIVVDSKGMRRMTDDETLVIMAESQTGVFFISMPLRLLFKLS